jgi:hypothetical protein
MDLNMARDVLPDHEIDINDQMTSINGKYIVDFV